jgi:hypothetical protein
MNARIKFLASAVAPAIVMGARLASSPALAVTQIFTTNMGNLDPDNSGFFDAIVPKKTQPFEDIGTFDLTVEALTNVAAHIGVSKPANYTPGMLWLYEGTPTSPGPLIDSEKLTYDSLSKEYVAGFTDLLGPDPYFAVIDGMTNIKNLGISGSVTTATIPESSTWAMLGLGFAGIGFVGMARRRKGSRYAL